MNTLMQQIWTNCKSNTRLRNILSLVYTAIGPNKRKIHGNNNIIKYTGAFLKGVKFDIIGNNNDIKINSGTRIINSTIRIRGNNHKLTIGESCICSNSTFWFEDSNCQIVIGRDTTMEGVGFSSIEPNSIIRVGEDCMFSYEVEVRTGDSHSIIDKHTKKRLNYAKNIEIGNHVWVGAHTKILKGVIIGDNSIVGLGSIVTKSVGSSVIVAGMPAKTVREDISWLRERIY